jgi:hypothetical protein
MRSVGSKDVASPSLKNVLFGKRKARLLFGQPRRIGSGRILSRSRIGLLLRLGNGARIDGTGNRIAFGNHSRAFSCAVVGVAALRAVSKYQSSELTSSAFL